MTSHTSDSAGDGDHIEAIRGIVQRLEQARPPIEYGFELPLEITKCCRGINHHADALQRQLDVARQKIEMLEWMAHQRRQRPNWSTEEILGRIPYLPEWRELEGITVQS